MKFIPLTRGLFAVVDEADYDELSKFNWFALKRKHTYYAGRNLPKGSSPKSVSMHRQIMGCPDGQEVDHEDGQGWNNQRYNLRVVGNLNPRAYKAKAAGKTSAFRGVRWCNRRKKWTAQIGFEYHQRYLGTFLSEDEAARAYDTAATALFGNLAALNFSERCLIPVELPKPSVSPEAQLHARLSAVTSGNKNPMFGRKHSEETRAKISAGIRRARLEKSLTPPVPMP